MPEADAISRLPLPVNVTVLVPLFIVPEARVKVPPQDIADEPKLEVATLTLMEPATTGRSLVVKVPPLHANAPLVVRLCEAAMLNVPV